MTERFKNKYRIPSSRLQSWDYGWDGAYFITICTQQRKLYLGNVIDEKMRLSHIGILADVFWYEIINHAENIILGEYVIMPNHVHGILILNHDKHGKHIDHDKHDGDTDKACLVSTESKPKSNPAHTRGKSIGEQRFQNQGKNTISSIIGSYKSAVTKHAHRSGYEFAWQSRFHDHIIRNEKSFNHISKYIINNPQYWKKDKFYR
jgi:REP-associated tyrosine transposase